MATGTGHGTTAAWTTATALNALQLISVDADGPTLGTIKTSHLGTTGSHTYIAQQLKEHGEVRLTYFFDPAVAIPIPGTADTLLIAWGGAGTANESSGPVILTNWKPSTIVVDAEELMTVEITCKCSGAWTHNQN